MILGLIFSVLSATFSLSSTTTVDVSGKVPSGASHEYARSATTGQKGQMTAGHSTCLSLTGWDGCTIRSVALQMRSNKSSGKGSLSVRVGSDVIWSIANEEFASSAWAGEYTTEWVNVQKDVECVVSSGSKVEIIISASENSLYIDSYTIIYEEAPLQCYSVDFKTGLDAVPTRLMQSAVGEPVVLPEWRDTLEWRFLGWSEEEVLDTSISPTFMAAGTSYVPSRNTILWAVYTDGDEAIQTVDYQSDTYVIAKRDEMTEAILGTGYGMAMYSGVEENKVALRAVQMSLTEDGLYRLETAVRKDMAYDVHFESDSTLTLRHVQSNMYIGYLEKQLCAEQSLWRYRVLEDGSILLYYFNANDSYALYFGAGVNGMNQDISAYAQRVMVDKWIDDALVLFPAIVIHYTSWPFGKGDGVETVYVGSEEVVYRFGLYELRVQNGKKTLRLLHM